jgi:LPS export ABC transporter protein LptC
LKNKIFKILVILIASVSLCCTDFQTDEGEVPAENFPDQESWGTKIYFQRDGKRMAVLTAGYLSKYYAEKYTILQEGVKVDFYDDNGELKSVLTSNEGKVYDDRSDMVAKGEVVVVSNNGTTLYTEELNWINKEGKIVSHVPVKITTEGDTLYGDTFKSDPDLINYQITNARGTSDKTISIDE